MHENYKKIAALAFLASFAFSQGAWAANPRQLLARAKSSFDTPDTRRGGFVSSRELRASHARQESLIGQKQVLAELQNLNPGAVSESLVTGQVVLPPEEAAFLESTN